jgi:nucleotide-binding universal stress UspA family protein
MKNILVTTDFSTNARNALNFALDLFIEDKCIFYLLNAFQQNEIPTQNFFQSIPWETNSNYEKTKNDSETGLKKLLDTIAMKADNSNHHFELISSYNTVCEAVKQTMENIDISIIIIGTQGETNADTILFGSNTLNIIEEIKNCQLLLVPPDSVFLKDSKKELVYATNFHAPFRYKELESMISIATNVKAAVRILHILENRELTTDQENNKEVLKEYLKGVESTFHTLTNEKVDTGVQSFIERRGSDMLALIHKKQSFLNKIFSGTTINKEFRHKPQIPIYMMHDPIIQAP